MAYVCIPSMTRNDCQVFAVVIRWISYWFGFCAILSQVLLGLFDSSVFLFSPSGPECYPKSDFDTAAASVEAIIINYRDRFTANSSESGMFYFQQTLINKIIVSPTCMDMLLRAHRRPPFPNFLWK